jgi:hypothetical protein
LMPCPRCAGGSCSLRPRAMTLISACA